MIPEYRIAVQRHYARAGRLAADTEPKRHSSLNGSTTDKNAAFKCSRCLPGAHPCCDITVYCPSCRRRQCLLWNALSACATCGELVCAWCCPRPRPECANKRKCRHPGAGFIPCKRCLPKTFDTCSLCNEPLCEGCATDTEKRYCEPYCNKCVEEGKRPNYWNHW